MAISNATVTRAKCDACPQVVYADAPAQPKGIQGHAQEFDGNGRETNARFFACQPNHVGAAIKNVLAEVKKGVRPAAVFPAPPNRLVQADDTSYGRVTVVNDATDDAVEELA